MLLNIYRDKYERIIPKDRPARCVQRLEDFPELQDAIVQANRADSATHWGTGNFGIEVEVTGRGIDGRFELKFFH